MAEENVKRKLTAILYADVAGYSRLTGEDEVGTHQQLSAGLDLISDEIEGKGGKVVHYAGDAVLADFSSVVAAVDCAVGIQRQLSDGDVGVSDDKRLQFRIGVNLGEVIVDRDDIYGDGVNVAARLESLAEPGGVCVSAIVFDQVKGKLDLSFQDMGKQEVKNIAEPVRAFRIELERRGQQSASATSAEAMLARPALAVLPFTNIGGDPENEYFADGLTEDLITALSYTRCFPVIASNSTFAYKGQSLDIRQVADELDARYVLEGSVRRGGERVRITAQLIDAKSGHHVWAEKFDRKLEDIFDLQDEITLQVAATLEPQIELAEQKRSFRKKPDNLDAWDYYLRGMAFHYEFTKEGVFRARDMFEKAAQLDPTYSRSFSKTAFTYLYELVMDYSADREKAIASALKAARRAVKLDDEDSLAHTALAGVYRWTGQHDMAVAEAKRAVKLNPSDASAFSMLGNILDLAGMPDEAIPNLEKALKLSPRDPRIHLFYVTLARANLNAHDYEEAIEWARKLQYRRPDDPRSHAVLAINLAHLGEIEEASVALDECERLKPGFAENWVRNRQYRNPSDIAHLMDGLHKAGLSE
jgi:adenylate cyclase